ncbi:MAG TPA: MFS transporter [Gaiellaceae bacterium]|nr:MFS transporter [Gaiellaceae bacterium]
MRQHHNVTLAILAVACTAYALLQTMVIPALPVLQRSLHTTTTWATWVLTVFLLVASVSTPILGRLGDQYGKERLLLISLALFLLGTIGCACAWNIWSLIAFRAVSAAGAGVFPLSFAIIRDEFPPDRVGVGIGLVSAVFGVGGGFGIVFAGLIVDNLSWRWLFIVGAILVAVSLVLVHRFVPESPIKTPSRVDVVGAALLSFALTALLVALSEGERWHWGSARTLGLFAASAVLFVVWGVVETRVVDPLVDMRMLAHRPILFTNATALIAGFAMFGTFVLIPNFVEMPHGLPATLRHAVHYGFDASATKAGLYLLPGSFMLLFAGPIAGRLGSRIGFKWPLAAGLLLVAASAGSLAGFHDRPWHIWLNQAVLGVGVGFAFAAMATLVAENVRPEETGVATGMNTVMRSIGGVVGGQVGAAFLAAYTIPHTGLPAEKGFTITFTVGAAAAVVGGLLATLVPEPRRIREIPLQG